VIPTFYLSYGCNNVEKKKRRRKSTKSVKKRRHEFHSQIDIKEGRIGGKKSTKKCLIVRLKKF